MNVMPYNCEECRQRLGLELDAISEPERRGVEEHLSHCAACAREAGLLAAIRDELHSLPEPALPAGLSARIKNAVRAEATPAPSPQRAARSSRSWRELLPAWLMQPRLAWSMGLAATACLLFVAIGLHRHELPAVDSVTQEKQAAAPAAPAVPHRSMDSAPAAGGPAANGAAAAPRTTAKSAAPSTQRAFPAPPAGLSVAPLPAAPAPAGKPEAPTVMHRNQSLADSRRAPGTPPTAVRGLAGEFKASSEPLGAGGASPAEPGLFEPRGTIETADRERRDEDSTLLAMRAPDSLAKGDKGDAGAAAPRKKKQTRGAPILMARLTLLAEHDGQAAGLPAQNAPLAGAQGPAGPSGTAVESMEAGASNVARPSFSANGTAGGGRASKDELATTKSMRPGTRPSPSPTFSFSRPQGFAQAGGKLDDSMQNNVAAARAARAPVVVTPPVTANVQVEQRAVTLGKPTRALLTIWPKDDAPHARLVARIPDGLRINGQRGPGQELLWQGAVQQGRPIIVALTIAAAAPGEQSFTIELTSSFWKHDADADSSARLTVPVALQ